MKTFFRWLWYVAFKDNIEPMQVDFPVGEARFVFSNVDVAPLMIVWCHGGEVVASSDIHNRTNETTLVLPSPAKAIGVMYAPDTALLTQVSVNGLEVTWSGMSVLAASFDVTRTVTRYVPRWRVFWESLSHLLHLEDDDEDL